MRALRGWIHAVIYACAMDMADSAFERVGFSNVVLIVMQVAHVLLYGESILLNLADIKTIFFIFLSHQLRSSFALNACHQRRFFILNVGLF